jgi:hypothetical protein
MPSRRSAYGGPEDGKEVVISFDRRFLYGLMLVAAFAFAVGGGYLLSRRGASVAAPVAPTPVPGAAGAQVDADAARATAMAEGLPTSVVIITPNVVQPVVATVTPGQEPGGVTFLGPDERAKVTPVDDVHGELLKDPNAQVFEVQPDPARIKDHEVLANTVDPNVDNSDYRPLRLETVSKPIEGPRLAISDLNLNYTYDLGPIGMTERASHTFVAKNVGTDDLTISRVYTGCGCTATTIGDAAIPPDGILPAPLTLKPGEQISFSVEYDAAAEGRPGATAKYVQIFSNDPTYLRFDDNEPFSHETRFRLVVEPRF